MLALVKALFANVQQIAAGKATQLHTDPDGNLWVTGSVQTVSPTPSDPVDMLVDAALPDAGGQTDPEATALPVPPWASSALLFVTYTASTNPGVSNPYAVGDVCISASPTGPLAFFAGLSSFVPGAVAREVSGIRGAKRLGVRFEEDGDPTNPGTISVQVVFR